MSMLEVDMAMASRAALSMLLNFLLLLRASTFASRSLSVPLCLCGLLIADFGEELTSGDKHQDILICSEVSSSGGDDGFRSYVDFLALAQRLAYVVFAHEAYNSGSAA